MALGQIVAYKRLWRENLIDGETQIPRSERNSQRARISGDRFTSLFEVKNCPTNGGKLTLGHRDRVDYGEDDREKHLSRLVAVINALDAGHLPDPVWKAGFYYNAAIMRIDACYERFLKAVEEAAAAGHAQRRAGEAETDALARHAESVLHLGSPLVRDHLRWVRKEVNKLKHALYGQQPQHAGERVEASDVNNALEAVAELVSMMERPEIKALLATRFGAPPPA